MKLGITSRVKLARVLERGEAAARARNE